MNKPDRKITKISSGKTYVPGITISGMQVQEAGFDYNTPVRVEYHADKISIYKVYNNNNIIK